MHTEPMKDSDGTFSDETRTRVPCKACKQRTVTFAIWESKCGGYEDVRYKCTACGHVWWIEGIDS